MEAIPCGDLLSIAPECLATHTSNSRAGEGGDPSGRFCDPEFEFQVAKPADGVSVRGTGEGKRKFCDPSGRFCDPEFEFQVAKPAAGSHWGEVLELFAVSEIRKPVLV